jgi:polar amino acid transport system substrate-binding protein
MTGRRLSLVAFLLLCAAPAWAGTLETVRASGKLRLGHRSDARPFSYVDEAGKPAGYSVALCEKIAEAVKAENGGKLEIEWVKADTEDRFEAIESGKIDLLCGAATLTLERRKNVDFSIPIFASGISALLRADSPERLRAALENRPEPYQPRWRANMAQVLERRVFSAEKGTTAAAWLVKRRADLEVNAQIVDVATYKEGVARVLSGDSDAFFGDRAILLELAARTPNPDKLVVLDRQYTYEPIALVTQRGDDDFRLLVDRTLSGLYRSGQIWEVYGRYFGKADDATQTFFRLATQPE